MFKIIAPHTQYVKCLTTVCFNKPWPSRKYATNGTAGDNLSEEFGEVGAFILQQNFDISS